VDFQGVFGVMVRLISDRELKRLDALRRDRASRDSKLPEIVNEASEALASLVGYLIS
jgi:hypothetical protein